MTVRICSAQFEVSEDDVIAILKAPTAEQVAEFKRVLTGKPIIADSVSDYDIPHLHTAAIDILGRRALAALLPDQTSDIKNSI